MCATPVGLAYLKLETQFLHLSSLNAIQKWLLSAAITQRGYYWGEKHLFRPVPSHIPVKITNYSNKLDSCIRTHHSQRRQRREGQTFFEWEETIGSLIFATIRELWLFETEKAAVTWCQMVPSQSQVFSVTCIALLVKQDFPDLKINANSYFQPISKRKESRTCVLFGKSGLGAIHLYLLFMPLFCVPVITLGIFQTNVTSMWQKWIVETGQTITVTCQIDSCLYSL